LFSKLGDFGLEFLLNNTVTQRSSISNQSQKQTVFHIFSLFNNVIGKIFVTLQPIIDTFPASKRRVQCVSTGSYAVYKKHPVVGDFWK